MSITLDKLRALKRQAGATLPDATPAGGTPAPGGAMPTRTLRTGALPPTRTVATPLMDAQDAANAGPAPRSGADAAHAPPSPDAVDPRAGFAPDAPHDDPGMAGSAVCGMAPRRPAVHVQPTPTDPPGPGIGHADHRPDPRRGGSLDALRRLLDVRERRPASSAPAPARRGPLDRRLPGEEIAPGLHYIETRIAYAAPEALLPLAFARRDGHVDPRALLFFDTETTGLAGGTGTRAFMIGAADWHGDDLRIRQLLIATMAAESAMLREFATWLAPTTVLASYNGRSYDAPLLKTRYRLARLPDPLHALDHLDLLHPTRRRYRGRWENCKLATIERELLRIVREDDLPGSQAPMAWLGYLRGGASALLHRVAAHNHQDVVTLARLLTRLADADGSVEPG